MGNHPDIQSLTPKSDFSRREFFLTGALAAGFTMAVRPLAASTIITPPHGLLMGEPKIQGADGVVVPGYYAKPESGSNFPVTLVVQEIFGVHEHIKDVCRRLAKLGHLAIAPELYVRQGDVSKLSNIQEILAIAFKAPDTQVMGDLDAAVRWAAANGGNVAKLGITGFCIGGRTVWTYAAHNPNLKAGVAWYGHLIREPTAAMPRSPIDLVPEIKAPVLGLYAGKDTGIPLDHVERMRAALRAANKNSEIVVYPDAQHAFHADYRPSYNEEAAKDGWNRLQAWFKQNGAA
jgi:carboxymethylenebutenolidase